MKNTKTQSAEMSMARIGKVLDQVRWDMKRGIIDLISIDHILDRAEEILTDEEYDEFSAGKEYIAVYQSA